MLGWGAAWDDESGQNARNAAAIRKINEKYRERDFIRCRRCDRLMVNQLGDGMTDYCSSECEMGVTPIPNQTREAQAETLKKQTWELVF